MPTITRVKIERFKRAHFVDISLGDVNVLVGANNSGKSSTIQALHFIITLFQSIQLAKRWQRGKRSTIFPEELIYSPADDPYRLYEEGRLQQSTFINFELTLDDGRIIEIDLTKGKNANLSARVDPIEPAQQLSSLVSPFSVYSPGLAGIARKEQYVSDGVLLRAVSRGDANLYLRNIIYRLSSKDQWDAFSRDIQSLFGNLLVNVEFDPDFQESIIINIDFGGRSVPLESCGTGLLQAIQILSYVHYFMPSIIILDEPDSHLHPNNQRLLCDLLQYINSEYGSKVVLTTHSRHMIDALQNIAQFIWVQNGQATVANADDHLAVLMDLGALDIKEIAQVKKRFFILTEDKITSNILNLFISNGFDEDDFTVQSYFGVTDPHRLRVIVNIVLEFQPETVLIVHRDRDYLTDQEVVDWENIVRTFGAEPFVTEQKDTEDYLIRPDYLSEKNANLTALEASELINRAVAQLRPESIADYTNGRADILRKAGDRNINYGQIAAQAAAIAENSPRDLIVGKKLRRTIRRLFQEDRGANLRTEGPSAHLVDAKLTELSRRGRPN